MRAAAMHAATMQALSCVQLGRGSWHWVCFEPRSCLAMRWQPRHGAPSSPALLHHSHHVVIHRTTSDIASHHTSSRRPTSITPTTPSPITHFLSFSQVEYEKQARREKAEEGQAELVSLRKKNALARKAVGIVA